MTAAASILVDEHGAPLILRGFPRALTEARLEIIEELPRTVGEAVLAEVEGIHRREGYNAAHEAIWDARDGLHRAHVHDAYDDDAVRASARSYARQCGDMPMLAERERFARSKGVEPPAGKTLADNYEGRARRLADQRWWRRRLRAAWTRNAERAMRDIGVIRKGREAYASNAAVQYRAAQKRKARAFLESHQLVNELGEQLDLLQIAEHSRANPAIRRGELMCRVRGFEETAAAHGHVAEFVTLTTPSRFHAYLAEAGRNPAYARAAVRDAQQWLCRMWARARAKLKRLSILYYGLRVAEPHHDGTPHWHLLLFAPEHQAETLRTVLRGIWLSDAGTERGAAEHRAKFERIDRSKGSAVGYVAKYVAKSVDGAGTVAAQPDDETGAPVVESVARIDAWASIHGIRQFQQLGGPPVGLWREARRLRDAVEDADIERARLAADRGDWAAFIQRVGGIVAGRHTNIRLEKAETGERNEYGECRPARVIGLRCASAVVFTRPHDWRIERKRPDASSSATQGHRPSGVAVAPSRRSSGHPASFSQSSRPASGRLGPVAITVRGQTSQPDTMEYEQCLPNQNRPPGPHRRPVQAPH